MRMKDQCFRQNTALDVSEIDGEKIMMDLENGCYFMLNDVASRIWELVEEAKSTEEIIDTLLGEYEVERSVCEAQVYRFMEELEKRTLIIRETM